MELNKKCLDIMAYLRQAQDYVTLEQLGEKYGVSVRGIRYSLDKIEQYMAANGMPYLEKEWGLGVRLPQDEAVYAFVDRCAGQMEPYQYSYSTEERQTFLRAMLLLTAAAVKTEDFCYLLERSRNTVLKDLEQAEAWITENRMILVKKPRVGMYVEGPEATRRELLTGLLMEGIPADDLLRYAMEQETVSRASILLLESLLPRPSARLVNHAVRHMETLLEKRFSDETFSNLAIRLSVMLFRSGGGQLELDVPNEGYIPLTNEYGAAKLVLEELAHQIGTHIPENEVVYFTYNLLGAKELKPDLADMAPEERDALRRVTEQMVDEIEEIYQVKFGDQREETIRGILLHLRPAIHRIRYGLYNQNPLYDEIVTNYNALFINTRIVCSHLEEYVGRPINDHEVAYIALHFGAALHRVNKRTSNRARVLLVCGTGLGSAKMIDAQIEKLYNVEVVDIVSGREAAQMDKRDVDYVITTVPLPKEDGCKYIQVSPMFTEKDQQAVGAFLTVRYTPKDRYDLEVSTANRLLDIVEKYCVVTDRLHLQHELLNELMNNNRLNLGRQSDEFRLCDLLTPERIVLGVRCRDWRESIVLAAQALEQQGFVRETYREAIIRSLEEYGPYMVMLPGVALAHARPEEGVIRLGMSMAVLATPVEFGFAEHDPVHVIVTLAAEDDKKHLKALAQLFRMLKDPEGSRAVFTGTAEEILAQIIHHSQ